MTKAKLIAQAGKIKIAIGDNVAAIKELLESNKELCADCDFMENAEYQSKFENLNNSINKLLETTNVMLDTYNSLLDIIFND